jgi:hypothetical protein
VRSAIDKFESDISGCIPQQAVIAHSEAIFSVETPGIPCVNGRHGAGVRSYEGRKREDAMAIVAAA